MQKIGDSRTTPGKTTLATGIPVYSPTGERLRSILAEGVGFEPTELSFNGFQDRRLKPLGHPSENLADTLHSSHVRPECLRNSHLPVGLLEIFKNRHYRPADSQPGTIQGMHEFRLCPVIFTEPDGCPTGLKILEIAAR